MIAFAANHHAVFPRNAMRRFLSPPPLIGLGLLMFGAAMSAELLWAVPMLNDPRGFQDIAWGAPLTGRQDLETMRSGAHVAEYRRKTEPLTFAGAEMTSILYISIDDQFARVTIRYQGEQGHKRVLNFLEAQFGSLQRVPGQMTRGLNQQYNWRGSDTEINLTYQAGTERGYIFIDSRTLAPRFNDDITDSAE